MTRDDVRQRMAMTVPTWTVGAGDGVGPSVRGVPRARDDPRRGDAAEPVPSGAPWSGVDLDGAPGSGADLDGAPGGAVDLDGAPGNWADLDGAPESGPYLRDTPALRVDPSALTRAARARFGAAAASAAPTVAEPPVRRRRARRRWTMAPRAAVVALLVLATIAGAVTLRSLAAATGTPLQFTEPAGTAAPLAAMPSSDPSTGTTDPPLLVHVVGQVAAPGLVDLSAGARVSDALAAAGGPLPDADLAALNLAAPVQDGEQVRVPTPGESAALPESGSGSTGDGSTGLVDINRATATELQELPGVGPVLADRIVADREDGGPFTDVDDLDRVSGIGPAVLAMLRDRATT